MGEYYFLSRQMNLSKIIIWILFSQYLNSLYCDPSYLLYAYVVCLFTESQKNCNQWQGHGQGLWSPRMPVYDSNEIFAKCCKVSIQHSWSSLHIAISVRSLVPQWGMRYLLLFNITCASTFCFLLLLFIYFYS